MVFVIDPYVAGISGDMILCSLVDLGADKKIIIEGIKSSEKFLPNSTIKKIDFEKVKKHGVESTELFLDIDEKIHERKGSEIKQAIQSSLNNLTLSDKAKKFGESCINTLISAESKIHGIPEDSVHFHEASSIDTLVDIVGTAIAGENLGLFDDNVVSMPVCVGGGTVTFSHGIMTNPASAVLEIFRNSNFTIHGGSSKSELTTPTGASILVNLATSSADYYPLMKIKSIGYGAGKKDFPDFANVLKIVRGLQMNNLELDSVIILETNVDDVSGEILGNLIEKIIQEGAKDVFISNGITKKGRPSNQISVICSNNEYPKIVETLISETGTLGIRIKQSDRIVVPRTIHELNLKIENKNFDVRFKVSEFKGVTNLKIEFDDLKKISTALNRSLIETESIIRDEITKKGFGNE